MRYIYTCATRLLSLSSEIRTCTERQPIFPLTHCTPLSFVTASERRGSIFLRERERYLCLFIYLFFFFFLCRRLLPRAARCVYISSHRMYYYHACGRYVALCCVYICAVYNYIYVQEEVNASLSFARANMKELWIWSLLYTPGCSFLSWCCSVLFSLFFFSERVKYIFVIWENFSLFFIGFFLGRARCSDFFFLPACFYGAFEIKRAGALGLCARSLRALDICYDAFLWAVRENWNAYTRERLCFLN